MVESRFNASGLVLEATQSVFAAHYGPRTAYFYSTAAALASKGQSSFGPAEPIVLKSPLPPLPCL